MTSLLVESVTLLGLSTSLPLPPPDPLGYPVPDWIMRSLSYLLLTLHLTAVHFTVGSALLLLIARLAGGEHNKGVARFLGSGLPLGVSYLVTLGIPPLLFVQVLYGQLFYSSSVLLGAYWIQVIPVLILAYGALYYHKMQRDRLPRFQGLVVAVAAIALLYIGYIYVNNFTLAASPTKWLDVYADSPAGGVLHHGERSLHPRYIFILGGIFATAGLALIWRGVYLEKWGQTEAGRHSRKFGLRALLLSPILWIVGGGGLFATTRESFGQILTDSPVLKILLAGGVLAALAGCLTAWIASRRGSVGVTALASACLLAATACMVVYRDLARMAALRPHWSLIDTPVHAQWGMFLLFVATLVAGLALLTPLLFMVIPTMARAARAAR